MVNTLKQVINRYETELIKSEIRCLEISKSHIGAEIKICQLEKQIRQLKKRSGK